MILRATALALLALLLTGCEGIQSSLQPEGPQAQRIAVLWWVMLGLCTVVLVVVCVLVVMAVFRGRRDPEAEVSLTRQQKGWLVLAGGVIVPAVVLVGLTVYSVAVGRAMTSEPRDPLVVDVVGHQWWWEVRYPDYEQPYRSVGTANELHIPAGRPVRVQLAARDVIHSFWVPNLHGKTDMVPGRSTAQWLQADRPGVFRGQCAEYCGLQHAHMAFMVVVHEQGEFNEWLEAQRAPAPEPVEEAAVRGREVFLGGPCAMCHTVRGTLALGTFGPDLTHVASRRTLAAGTVLNTRGHLGGWILNPHAIKPGVRMPPVHLSSEDLHALLAYLETLK